MTVTGLYVKKHVSYVRIFMSGPPKRLNQRDMDSSSYRLSRVPQKFSLKAAKDEQQDSYAVNYYASNPIDTRTPEDKLEEVNSKLGEDLSEDEMFALLIQKRALCQMIYGENSTEAIIATTELGAFYNKNGKPNSAMRNLAKVQAVAKTADLSSEQALSLAVELADACLNAVAKTRQDKGKQVATADSALTPHAKTESSDLMTGFRRDLYLARIRSYRNRWRESLAFYVKALDQYEPAHPKDENDKEKEREDEVEEANLCVEAGQVAEKHEEWKKAIELFKKAKELYEEMEYEEDARRLADRIENAQEMLAEKEGNGETNSEVKMDSQGSNPENAGEEQEMEQPSYYGQGQASDHGQPSEHEQAPPSDHEPQPVEEHQSEPSHHSEPSERSQHSQRSQNSQRSQHSQRSEQSHHSEQHFEEHQSDEHHWQDEPAQPSDHEDEARDAMNSEHEEHVPSEHEHNSDE